MSEIRQGMVPGMIAEPHRQPEEADGERLRKGTSMLVEQLPGIREQLVSISVEAPLIEAAKLLHGGRISLVIVCSLHGSMARIITKTDIVRQISSCQGTSCTTTASSVMTREVTFCHPDILLTDAWSMMKERGLKHLPIVDGELRPVGILNARQAVQALLNEVESEEDLLRDYIGGVGYR
jgi:CBS domain-containing protein